MRLSLVLAALLGAACLPPVAVLEGKACDAEKRCPAGLTCRLGACIDPANAKFACEGNARADAGWVFCSGFEEGSLALWDDMDGNPTSQNEIVAEPGRFGRSDNHVGWLKELPGASGTDLVKDLPATHSKLYARWWIKYRAGFQMDQASAGRLHAGSRNFLGATVRPTGSDHASAGIDYHAADPRALYLSAYLPGMYQDCPGSFCTADSYPCVYDSGGTFCVRSGDRPPPTPGPQLEADRWYCMEMMVDLGAPTSSATGASGRLALWLDDAPQGEWSNLWMRSSSSLLLTTLYLRLYHGTANHSLVGVYYDDVVVSTDRVGCEP